MSYVSVGTNSQTVTVATEIALANTPVSTTSVPTNSVVAIFGVVQCAAGTGGTTAALKVRQGIGASGTQVGTTLTGTAQTANAAQIIPFLVFDTAPVAAGTYSVTLTFTGNSSSVVSSNICAIDITGLLSN